MEKRIVIYENGKKAYISDSNNHSIEVLGSSAIKEEIDVTKVSEQKLKNFLRNLQDNDVDTIRS